MLPTDGPSIIPLAGSASSRLSDDSRLNDGSLSTATGGAWPSAGCHPACGLLFPKDDAQLGDDSLCSMLLAPLEGMAAPLLLNTPAGALRLRLLLLDALECGCKLVACTRNFS